MEARCLSAEVVYGGHIRYVFRSDDNIYLPNNRINNLEVIGDPKQFELDSVYEINFAPLEVKKETTNG